jgi:cell division protein FtsB
MAGPARGPGARPATGARPTPRRSARPVRPARSPGAVTPTGAAGSRPGGPGRSGRRGSVTSRAAVLALVLVLLAVSYAYPLRAWYDQHTRRSALEQESAELHASIDRLETELRLWDDPAYVRAQARERLSYVLPGEVGYVVVDEDGNPEPVTTSEGIPVTADGPWYSRLWASLQAADARPADEAE